jgi:hypothetical protein
LGLSADQGPAPEKTEAAADDLARGWQRAIYEISGTLKRGTWPELPEAVESISPVIDVLHTSGERGTLELPSGRSYAVFSFPNLETAHSKVIAIGEGSPIAEFLALHRYPVLTGAPIDEGDGLLPSGTSVAEVCEAVTGRAPKDTSGRVFAVQGDAVWIERGGRAIRWDGARERDDGTLKQALASLVLDWSRR